jgi:predicted ATPase
MLLVFRPDFPSPWAVHSHLTHIALSRLSRRQVETMVEKVTRGKALPAEVLQELVAKTDGVPLFVEELIKMVLESGLVKDREGRYELAGPLPPLAIPATLHDSLMARLDRLEIAKQVAQLGATLGREFAYEVIQAVSPMAEETLQRALAELVAAELLYLRGLPPQARYRFKHALIQEAAYESLLRRTRQQYHRQIAQVLEERFPDILETQPELLAYHYTEAGQSAQAIPYWQRAGQRAIERSANLEAISHLTKGLEVLKTLPGTPERIQYELTLQLALGPPLLMLKGQTAKEVEYVYNRALELCQQVGDSRQRFSALTGLYSAYSAQGKQQTPRELAEQSLILAQDVRDPVLLQVAHTMLGSTLFCMGEFVSARLHLEQGLDLYSYQQHRTVLLSRGVDSEVAGSTWLAWSLWMLGYPDQAMAKSHEVLHLAQGLSHAYSLAFALFFSALLYQCRREVQCVQERLDAVMSLSNEQGFVRWLAGGMMLQGWVLTEQGSVEEGIAQLQQGLVAWRAMGGELALPHYLAMLAEAYGKGGRVHEGLCVLKEALAIAHKNAEHRLEAELLRLKGELLLQARERGNGRTAPLETSIGSEVERIGATQALSLQVEAEICFRQAIHVARQQHAKCLELRAVVSLSRLWRTQDKRAEAHQMLAESYGWFTEGFETPDLQEAKDLLAAWQ